MAKLNVKTLSLIAIMAALSNVLSFFRIVIPGPVPIVFQIVQFPYLLLAVGLGPLEGAITGTIGSLIMAYTIWSFGGAGPFIPIGNAILAGVTGIVAKKLRVMERKTSFWPVLCAVIGEIAEAPYIILTIVFWTVVVGGAPFQLALVAIALQIVGKAFLEVIISAIIVSLILNVEHVKEMLIDKRACIET